MVQLLLWKFVGVCKCILFTLFSGGSVNGRFSKPLPLTLSLWVNEGGLSCRPRVCSWDPGPLVKQGCLLYVQYWSISTLWVYNFPLPQVTCLIQLLRPILTLMSGVWFLCLVICWYIFPSFLFQDMKCWKVGWTKDECRLGIADVLLPLRLLAPSSGWKK